MKVAMLCGGLGTRQLEKTEYHLINSQAAMGVAQLSKLPTFIAAGLSNPAQFRAALADLEDRAMRDLLGIGVFTGISHAEIDYVSERFDGLLHVTPASMKERG